MKTALTMILLVFGVGLLSQGPAEVRIRFVDDQTGFAIPAQAIQLNSPARSQGLPAGMLTVERSERAKVIAITATGYKTLSFTIYPTDTFLQVRLSPTAPPREFSPESIASFRGARQILIIGFVSDATSGTALPGVKISARQLNANAETNDRGFFVLRASAPATYSSDTAIRTDVRFDKAGYRSVLRQNARVTIETVAKYRVSLEPGAGVLTIHEQHRGDTRDQQDSDANSAHISKKDRSLSPTLPSSIRVGRNCSTSTSCTTVEVAALEDYTKHVLPNEWVASWRSESLKAGSVAVRSVGTWYTVHPKTDSYDVCDTTACQVYDPDSSNGSTDAATDATAKNVLVERGTDTVAKAEYAAENNHHDPCNDGQTGDGSSWPCSDDKLCLGQAVNGHGRGMCQNGSQRWASQSSKDMDWILTHYYPNLDKVVGN